MNVLQGRAALVTGGGTGIGRAIARALAAAGAAVMVTDLDAEAAARVAAEIVASGGQARSMRLDVTNRGEAERAVAATVEHWGRIDILINNAGVSTMNHALDLTDDEWDFNMDVNAKGVFIVSQVAGRQMVRQGRGAKIISIASMAGKIGAPLLAHYSASKFAVVGFTQALANELAPHGVTVNAVCPGFVRTSMQEREVQWEAKMRGITPDEVRADYLRQVPLGRLEEPEDVAKVVVFLASSMADYMTGQAVNVTGGACMH